MKKLSQLLKESQELDYRRMNVGEEETQGMTKEEKRAFVEAVAAYRQLGEMISHKGNLTEIHESIKGIVENANNLTLKETGDWFDRVTVQRHMKSMNESFKIFSNTIKEVSTLQQRLESSYDEIGEVLGKYYEIKEGNEFGAERAKAIAAGEDSFEVDGKSYKVTGVDDADKKNAEKFANESMKLTSLIKRNEELTGKQKELDVDSDGDIEADDLADLRAGKKPEESVNEATLKQGTMLRYDKNNFVVDYVVDKKYTGKDGFDKYILKVVKSNFPNKIKVGSTEEYEDSKLTGLIRNKVMNFVKNESVNEEEIKWNAVENAIINFLKVNTKILDKRVQAKDTDGVKGGLKSIINGLTNAQRSLKLESVNEASYVSGYTVKAKTPYEFVNGAYAVLNAYLRDEELGPKGKKELQDVLKSLEYMRKYFFFKLSESVNEGISPKDMEAIKSAVEAASSFMSVGSELKKLGMRYIFATSPMPVYIVQDKSGNRVGIINKKYATKPDFVVGDIAVGVMEGVNSVNEITLARGLKDLIKGTTSSVEGIKISKELANAIASWTTGSTYGQRYGSQMLKAPFANVWQMVFSSAYGLEPHLKRYDKEALANLKPELMKIKAKLEM